MQASPTALDTAFADRDQFDQAVRRAKDAAAAYYAGDTLLMADGDYDRLIDQIAATVNAHPDWDHRGVLTEVAAGAVAGGDVPHGVPMLSLDKATTADEIAAFVSRFDGAVACVEVKVDGVAVRARYHDGRLVLAATRGDGHSGEDITAQVLRHDGVHGLPAELTRPWSGEVRGEAYMTNTDFEQANTARIAHGKTAFVNPRNAVAGVLRKRDLAYPVPMSFAVYAIAGDEMSEVDSHHDRMELATALGLHTSTTLTTAALPPQVRSSGTRAGEIATIVSMLGQQRDQLIYPIDGAVIKADSRHVRADLGASTHAPRWALAYKFEPDAAFSILRDIEVGVGRTGQATFRGVIDPIVVDGTTITYASLHNATWITRQGLGTGSRVAVVRAGDVIPRITAAIDSPSDNPADNPPDNAPGDSPSDTVLMWEPPVACPQCGQPWDTSTQMWRCTTPTCSLVSMLAYAASRDVWDIDGLGEEIATALVDGGLATNLADLFDLTADRIALARYPGSTRDQPGPTSSRVIGSTIAEKLVAGIAAAKALPLARHITALGIRMTGRRIGRTLATHFQTLDNLRAATLEDLTAVDGIGSEKARAIHAGLRANTDVLDRLVAAGITTEVEQPPTGSTPLVGKTVVITGTVPGLRRTEAHDAAIRLGATVTGSVSKNTDLLIVGTGSSTRSKLTTAHELGVATMTAEQFLALR